MDVRDLLKRAIDIRQQYAELEHKRYGRSWTEQEIALGFVGDVGDLMKLGLAARPAWQKRDTGLT